MRIFDYLIDSPVDEHKLPEMCRLVFLFKNVSADQEKEKDNHTSPPRLPKCRSNNLTDGFQTEI